MSWFKQLKVESEKRKTTIQNAKFGQERAVSQPLAYDLQRQANGYLLLGEGTKKSGPRFRGHKRRPPIGAEGRHSEQAQGYTQDE